MKLVVIFDMLNAPSNLVSLKRRVLGAASWSIAGFALSNAIRLGNSLFMTRLLIPEMFGVMAIAIMVMTGLEMFSDVGLKQNIVQSQRGSDSAYLNTAWAIQIIRGLLLCLLALCISLLVFAANHFGLVPKASVYADRNLPYVIAVVSVSAAISGFQSTKSAEASRSLSLGRLTQIQIAAQIIGLICMIGWILIDRSIWALVAGYICSTVVTTLLSHIWLPGVANRWQWDQSAFHEIIHFGKWMFLSSLLGFLANNADRILLGGFIDSAMLGIYIIAANIFGSLVQVLYKFIGDVSFSALSEVARDRSRDLKRSFYRIHIVIGSVAYFCAGILVFTGHNLIDLLYDRRYEQAGWMLEVLAVGLLPIPFELVCYCLLALGLPKYFTQLTAISVVGTLVFIPFGYYFLGIPGAIWGVTAGNFIALPAIVYYQIKYGLFDLSKEARLLLALPVGMILGKGISYALGH
jgi:O-antigen/teichoic acid export membrane protein